MPFDDVYIDASMVSAIKDQIEHLDILHRRATTPLTRRRIEMRISKLQNELVKYEELKKKVEEASAEWEKAVEKDLVALAQPLTPYEREMLEQYDREQDAKRKKEVARIVRNKRRKYARKLKKLTTR